MKTKRSFSLHSTVIEVTIVLLIVVTFQGCGIKSAINKLDSRMAEAIYSMDKAIATLGSTSADWQTVITDLGQNITKEMQSTLDNEVQNLTRNAVLTTGGEVRCNAEFMRVKLRRQLIEMRNSLAQSLNAQLSHFGLSAYQFAMTPQDIPQPFICDIVPSAVDLSLDPDRRKKLDIYGFDLRSMPIYVTYRSYGLFQAKPSIGYADYVREMTPRIERRILNTAEVPARAVSREDIQMTGFTLAQPYKLFNSSIGGSLSVLSDFHAVLDLTAAGANLPPNSNEIVFSWNNKLQSEIPILTDIQTLECVTTGVPLRANLAETYIPPAVEGPDQEFAGHGPCMTIDINLSLDAERKNLYATIYLDAFECNDDFSSPKKDHTEACGTKTVTLFTVTGDDETIVSYDAASELYDTFIDTSDDPSTKHYSGTSPVEKIEWIGDTDGDEAGTRTGVTVTFQQFKVNVQKCVYK